MTPTNLSVIVPGNGFGHHGFCLCRIPPGAMSNVWACCSYLAFSSWGRIDFETMAILGFGVLVGVAGGSTSTTFHAKKPPVQIILRWSLHAPLIQAPWATGHHSQARAHGGSSAQASGHGRGHGDHPVEPKLRRVRITWAFQIWPWNLRIARMLTA